MVGGDHTNTNTKKEWESNKAPALYLVMDAVVVLHVLTVVHVVVIVVLVVVCCARRG